MTFSRSALIAVFIFIAGCSKDGLYQGLYEGARIQNRKELSPRERATQPDLDYQQYSNELKGRTDVNR